MSFQVIFILYFILELELQTELSQVILSTILQVLIMASSILVSVNLVTVTSQYFKLQSHILRNSNFYSAWRNLSSEDVNQLLQTVNSNQSPEKSDCSIPLSGFEN